MKSIFILLLSLISFSLVGQETSNTFYKNQLGIDILPTIVGVAADNQSLLSRIELTYRRALTPNYSGALRLEMNFDNTRNIEYRYDTLSIDTSFMVSTLTGHNYSELSFVLSRKFQYKKVQLYGGFIFGVSAMSGTESTITRSNSTPPYDINVIYSNNIIIPVMSYGVEFGLEVPIAQRWSLLFNLHTIFRQETGSWKYLNSNSDLVTSSIRDGYFEFFRLSNLMLLHQF